MAVVLDTDIVSYLHKQDSRAQFYRPYLSNFPYVISFMTLAEMRRWTLEKNWGETKREELEEYLSTFLIVYADDELCHLWSQAIYSAQKNGKPIAAADAWVASVALLLNAPLLTNNYSHFIGVDNLKIISETNP